MYHKSFIYLEALQKFAFILLALFLFSLNIAFAQEVVSEQVPEGSTETQEEIPQNSETPSDEQIVASEEVSSETAPSEELPLEEESMMSSMGMTLGEDGALTSVSTLDTKVLPKVSGNTGALTYEYMFTVPQGRGGAFDGLNLNYSNQDASDTDIFGYGWKLSSPYIEVINKTGIENLYSTTSTQYFNSSLSGELVQVGTSSVYMAKYEKGDYLRYERKGNAWEVTDKDGTKFTFGTTTQARLDNPVNNQQIYRWMIERVEDTNGNFTTFTYTKNAGTIYPATINYSGFGGDSGIYQIEFTLSSTTAKTTYEKRFASTRNYVITQIDVETSGQLSRRFVLEYGDGIGEKRDLLIGITETGFDGGNSLVLPETVFSYEGSQKPTWQSGQYSGTFPEPMSSNDLGVRFGDLNGDGLTDVVRYHVWADYDGSPNISHGVRRVHINKGNGHWDYDVEWNWDDIHVPFMVSEDGVTSNSWSYHDMGTRMIDVNGDGKDDLVVAYDAPNSHYSYPSLLPLDQIGVYLNTGSGFTKSSTWTNLAYFSVWSNSEDDVFTHGRELIDVNGDALPDLVTAYLIDSSAPSAQANTYSNVMLNTGSNWVASSFTFPAPLAQDPSSNGWRAPEDVGTRIADVNNDGLVDVLRGYRIDSNGAWVNYKDDSSVYINTGTGWATSSTWAIPGGYFIVLNYGAKNRGYHMIDINGDRLVDIVKSRDYDDGQYELYVNTGNGWTQRTHTFPFYLNQSYSSYSTGVAVIDFDGDTLVDGWDLQYNDLYETHATGGVAYINQAEIPDQLTGVELVHGGNININLDGYVSTNFSNYSKIGTSTMNPVVVTDVTYDPGVGASFTTDYDYEKADFHFASSSFRERKYLGFEKVVETSPTSKKTSYYHQGNGNNGSTFEVNDDLAKAGMVYREEIASPSNNLYTINASLIETYDRGNGAKFAYVDQVTALNYDGDSDHRDTAISYAYDTTNGSLLAQEELGEVIASSSGTYIDIGTDKKNTEFTYATNTAGMVLKAGQTIKDQNSQKVAEQRYYYDNLSLGAVSDGNLTKLETWLSNSSYASSTYGYDSRGLKTNERSPLGQLTSFSYDANNLFVSTTTNPLGQKIVTKYNLATEKPKWTKDANNIYQHFAYDPVGRLTKIYVATTSATASSIKHEFTHSDTKDIASILKVSNLDGGTSHREKNYVDGFDRLIQKRQLAESEDGYAVRDYYYGVTGLLEKESVPYYDTTEDRESKTTIDELYTQYAYDPLGRTTLVSTSVGDTTTTFDQWSETVEDALSNEKKYTYNAYGDLVEVNEYNDSNTYTTQYEWDLNKNLTKVTDALANVRNFTYNGRSDRLTAQDLHDSSDATFGEYDYEYDLAGNVLNLIDPKSQEIEYVYDFLGRVSSETLVGSPLTQVSYVYDSCTNGIGKLCSVSSASATTTYQYNIDGLISSEVITISGTTYTTSYQYDHQGNKTTITYPNSSETRYTFNQMNKIESVEYKPEGGSYQDVITNRDYAATGQIEFQTHANETQTFYEYNPLELYRLMSQKTYALQSTTTEVIGEFQTVSNETFESGLGGWTKSGVTNWFIENEAEVDIPGKPTNNLVLHSDSCSGVCVITSNTGINLTGYQNATLNLWRFMDGDFDSGEYMKVEVFNGSSWVQVASWAASSGQDTNTWENVDIDITSHMNSALKVRLSSNQTSSSEDGEFDDVKIIAQQNNSTTTIDIPDLKYLDTRFVYDAVGNIVTKADYTPTESVAHLYEYDDLYRLTGYATATAQLTDAESYFDGEVTYQPNGSDGKDTYFGSVYSTGGMPASSDLVIGGWGDTYTSLIEFDLDGDIPAEGVNSAYLSLFSQTVATNANSAKLYRNTSSWTETGALYGNSPSSVDYGMAWQSVPNNAWWTVDVTEVVKDWLDGTNANYGWKILGQGNNNQVKKFWSSDYSGETLRPKLVIDAAYSYETVENVTIGTSTPTEAYTYDALGNILTKTGQGTYAYQGDQGSVYANPHAATAIGSTTYQYDQNGNLLTISDGTSYVYDHLNHLIESEVGSSTVTYAYNHAGRRVKKTGATTTLYPFSDYEVTGSDKRIHLYADDILVATIDISTSTTDLVYNHVDYQGSSRLVTDTDANVIENTTYYPFGTERSRTGSYDQNKSYIGQELDEETDLSYLQARYYNGTGGKFTSQDPVFWEIGKTNDGVSVLKNPQAQNSYSYAQNNPIVLMDPEGRMALGVGVSFGANAPGIFGQQSFHFVLAGTNLRDMEAGILSTTGSGGTTAIGEINVGVSGMYSQNARNIEDLEGVDVGGGASWGSGPSLGGDITTSKPNAENKRITTVSGSAGFGLVASPLALPAEVHGGAYYTKSIASKNVLNSWNSVKSGTQSSYSTMRNQLSSIASQLRSLRDKLGSSKNNDSKKKS